MGGYPEWASHCEDILFDLALRRAGARFAFVPDALVLFRPRGSLRAFARQYFLYARGDGVANLWPRRHAIRYVTYSAAAALLLGARRRPWLLALALPGGLAYIRAPLRRLRARAPALATGELAGGGGADPNHPAGGRPGEDAGLPSRACGAGGARPSCGSEIEQSKGISSGIQLPRAQAHELRSRYGQP